MAANCDSTREYPFWQLELWMLLVCTIDESYLVELDLENISLNTAHVEPALKEGNLCSRNHSNSELRLDTHRSEQVSRKGHYLLFIPEA